MFCNFVRFYVNGRTLIKTHLCAVTKPCNIKTNNKLIQLQCLLMHPCHNNNLSNKSMCQLMSTFTGMFVCLIVFLGDHLHSKRIYHGLVRDTLIAEKPFCKVNGAHLGLHTKKCCHACLLSQICLLVKMYFWVNILIEREF